LRPRRRPIKQRGSQDLAITILGCHLRRAGSRVWSGGMVEMLGEFGFSVQASRAALARLAGNRMLERHRSGRRINYGLTPKIRDLLSEGDRRIFNFGRVAPAVDVWTLVCHSIPEGRRGERARLAARLRFLGFGSPQDATWFAASDRESEVRELIKGLGVEQFVLTFKARMVDGAEPALANCGAWDLDALGERYEEFLAAYGPLADPAAQAGLSAREAFVRRIGVIHTFRDFSLLDPELPDSIVPLGGPRARAVEVFDAVYEGLRPAAERHFALVLASVPDGPVRLAGNC
jgi:phenylacetic acid degradation operon negative regulatory protein